MAITKRFAKVLDSERTDNDRTIKALRLQAQAWRLLTFIALFDQERAKTEARWLIFNTLPWVNGDTLEKYIAERQELAEDYAVKSGAMVRKENTPDTPT